MRWREGEWGLERRAGGRTLETGRRREEKVIVLQLFCNTVAGREGLCRRLRPTYKIPSSECTGQKIKMIKINISSSQNTNKNW
jgi:hypothetical protein